MPTPDGSAQAAHSTLICILIATTAEAVRGLAAIFRSHSALAAENLFLRKYLAFYQERQTKPHLTDAGRFSLALWSRLLIGKMHGDRLATDSLWPASQAALCSSIETDDLRATSFGFLWPTLTIVTSFPGVVSP
jgi:hypothetical protein